MIREHDIPSDLLQHLAEFQANCMQLSYFESKPVWFLRLHIYLLDVSSNPPPHTLYTHFQAEGWDKLSAVVGFSCHSRRGDLRGCAGPGPAAFCPRSPRLLCFGFCCLKIYTEGRYRKDL